MPYDSSGLGQPGTDGLLCVVVVWARTRSSVVVSAGKNLEPGWQLRAIHAVHVQATDALDGSARYLELPPNASLTRRACRA